MPVGDDTWYHVDGGVLTHNLPVGSPFLLTRCLRIHVFPRRRS